MTNVLIFAEGEAGADVRNQIVGGGTRQKQSARRGAALGRARLARAPSRARPRTAQQLPAVPKADIVAAGYDLSLNRYKEVEHEEVAHDKFGRDPRRVAEDRGGESWME